MFIAQNRKCHKTWKQKYSGKQTKHVLVKKYKSGYPFC